MVVSHSPPDPAVLVGWKEGRLDICAGCAERPDVVQHALQTVDTVHTRARTAYEGVMAALFTCCVA